eukprot:scaffold37927_cov18-Tisochrysis_lutea.AAC.1
MTERAAAQHLPGLHEINSPHMQVPFGSRLPRLSALPANSKQDTRISPTLHPRYSTTAAELGPGSYASDLPQYVSHHSAYEGKQVYYSLAASPTSPSNLEQQEAPWGKASPRSPRGPPALRRASRGDDAHSRAQSSLQAEVRPVAKHLCRILKVEFQVNMMCAAGRRAASRCKAIAAFQAAMQTCGCGRLMSVIVAHGRLAMRDTHSLPMQRMANEHRTSLGHHSIGWDCHCEGAYPGGQALSGSQLERADSNGRRCRANRGCMANMKGRAFRFNPPSRV